MLTLDQAKKIAENKISSFCPTGAESLTLVITEKEVIEKPYVYIFPYCAKEFLETADFKYMLVGNSPLFISKKDGSVKTYASCYSVESMIEMYEEENCVWALTLGVDIYANIPALSVLKKILALSQQQLNDLKKTQPTIIAKGGEKRLLELQKRLSDNSISTHLSLSAESANLSS